MIGRLHLPARARARRPRAVALAAVAVALLAVIAALTIAVARGGGAARSPGPPPAAKPFTLSQLGHPGRKVSLAGLAGKPVIVNFFASWCGPCQRETPMLARFYAAHHGQIAVVGVDANDQKAAAQKFVRTEGVSYPVGVDPFPATTATSYGVLALPQTFFLNARHQIVRHVVGGLTARELSAWAARIGGP
jgi:cytochrome c biogenesis protein CcmG, thiol:disulfide interchange protein DsbE